MLILRKIMNLKNLIQAQTKKQSIILNSLYLVFISLILTLLLSLIQYQSFTILFTNITTNFVNILLTFILFLILTFGFYFISSSLRCTLLCVMLPALILSVINYKKFLYRQEVLVPMDFLQIREALNIVSSALKINFFTPKFIALMALFVIAFLITFFIKKRRIHFKVRLSAVIVFPVVLYYFIFSSNCIVDKLSPSFIYENTNGIYNRRGFMIAFLNEIPDTILSKPENYNKKNVERIYNSMSVDMDENTSTNKPNIIVILNESFTDPTNFKGVNFSIDPLEGVRKYMNSNGYLNMISPQIGGGTANVEYEVLTGVSISLFSNIAIAYQQYVNKPHFSMARYLNNEGYISLGIHPYTDWFWRRNKVYPLLGFRDFYSMDDMINQGQLGPFISDLSLSKEIIAKYEENKEFPVFINGISMQNHLPYNQKRYSANETKVTIQSNIISDEFKSELTEYVNGVYYASEALSYLIDYFKKVEEPTYIVMYGDHQPAFANYEDEYYKILGYEPDSKLDYLLYQTPVIFWSNQPSEKIETDYISPFLLGKEVLKYSNVGLPDYFKVLEKFNESIKVVNGGFVIDNNNNFIYRADYNNILINDINLISYDINFGKNYLNYNINGQ